MIETLKKFGLKVTAPRVAVLSEFKKTKHYTNAQEIHTSLKKIDLVTIYRTLASFEKGGLIKRVNVQKDAVYYELAGGHHHHIICTNCEKMEEFSETKDEALIKDVLKKVKGFASVSHHSFDLFGLCNSCNRKNV